MKFRVFDNEEKRYIEEDNIVLLPDGSLRQTACWTQDFEKIEEEHPDRYVVEMSTGLKDKNGVEIYEGDVVLYEHPYAGTAKINVEYDKQKAVFDPLYCFNKSFEIIGNIHEAKQWIYR